MTTGLKRYQETRDLHFVTFSCYHRLPLLGSTNAKDVFEENLEKVRRWYKFFVTGYVIMPEHVHLLLSEPDGKALSTALQMLKQNTAIQMSKSTEHLWMHRYYDFNVRSQQKVIEKLRYMHRNPVLRGLVSRPEEWRWSSFQHYLTGEEGTVEIESQWTARKRERSGEYLQVKFAPVPPSANGGR